MKAIVVKRGQYGQFKATDGDRNNATSWKSPYHAALKLCAKMDWAGTLAEGEINNKTTVYVWVVPTLTHLIVKRIINRTGETQQ